MSLIESRPEPWNEPHGTQFQYLQGLERVRLLHRLQSLEDRTVRGWHGGRAGGVHRVRDVRVRVAALTSYIAEATAHGSRKHQTAPRWLRWLALVPLLTDFSIIALYFSVVLNVPLDRPMDTPVQSFTAVVFALIVSLGLFLTLRWIAVRRRGFKNDAGRYEASEEAGGWLSRMELVVVAVLLVGVAMVMLVRVFTDAQDAGVELGAVWVVAGFLAIVTAVLNWCLYLLEFADGSDETHELDHWGRALQPVDQEILRLSSRLRDIEAVLNVDR